MRRNSGWLAFFAALFVAAPAAAQEFTPIWWVDELRGGLYYHSVDAAGPGTNPIFGVIATTRGVDVNGEILFSPFDLGDLAWLGKFRPHVGATISTNGLESMIYAGLSWTFYPFDGPVFIEGTFGGSINNWDPANPSPLARNLGCNTLFRESASIGVDVTENASIMLTVEHASHAGLCVGATGNQGLTNFGARVGFRF